VRSAVELDVYMFSVLVVTGIALAHSGTAADAHSVLR